MDPTIDFADRLELFCGEASDALGYVYARLRGTAADEGYHLTGSIVGPQCRYASTLPATFKFSDLGPGNSLLAKANIPEPCFWTTDMPHLYRAEVQLVRDGCQVANARRTIGLRRLGAQGRKLIHEGKRWVLRGVRHDHVPPHELSDWRECGGAMLVRNPNDSMCQEASQLGVLLLAELDHVDVANVHRLSRWPAVAMVTLPVQPDALPGDVTGFIPHLPQNLLLVQRFTFGQPLVPAAWAHVALCEIGDLARLSHEVIDCPCPLLAMSDCGKQPDLSQARALCDDLQRRLVGHGEFSGYIV